MSGTDQRSGSKALHVADSVVLSWKGMQERYGLVAELRLFICCVLAGAVIYVSAAYEFGEDGAILETVYINRAGEQTFAYFEFQLPSQKTKDCLWETGGRYPSRWVKQSRRAQEATLFPAKGRHFVEYTTDWHGC